MIWFKLAAGMFSLEWTDYHFELMFFIATEFVFCTLLAVLDVKFWLYKYHEDCRKLILDKSTWIGHQISN